MFILANPIKLEVVSNGLDVVSILTIIVPSVISMVGVFLSYKAMSKNFKNELSKIKKEAIVDKTTRMLDLALKLFPEKTDKQLSDKELTELQKLVTAYGSTKCVMIFSEYKQLTFNEKSDTQEKFKESGVFYNMFALLSLFISQLKYDTTDEMLSPVYYLKMRITDFKSNSIFREEYMNSVNKYIEQLNLNKGFKIKDDGA